MRNKSIKAVNWHILRGHGTGEKLPAATRFVASWFVSITSSTPHNGTCCAEMANNEPLFERIYFQKWNQIGDHEDLGPFLPYVLRYALEINPDPK